MIPDDWSSDPTRLLGLVSFGFAAAACGLAARRERGSAPVWWLLASAQGVLFAEVMSGMRHRVHALVDALLRANGLYESRSGLQIALLVAGLLAFVGIGVAATRLRRHGTGTAPAASATLIAGALVMAEAVSLHRLDALMYAPVGPVRSIALGWAACAVVVIGSALRRART